MLAETLALVEDLSALREVCPSIIRFRGANRLSVYYVLDHRSL